MLYKWIRDTGVGEITYIIGHLYRVFFQSHIWGIFGFFTFIGAAISKPKERIWWTLAAGLSAFVVIISLSRSFWLGGGIALCLTIVILLMHRASRIYFFRVAVIGVSALVTGYVGFQWSLNFPYLWNHSGSGSLVQARAEISTESAASSRRELLSVMGKAILQRPIFGSGFGTSLTYQTKDPRVNFSGDTAGSMYTTTAFELGYHTFALQFGLPLTLVFAVILFWFFWTGWKILILRQSERGIVAGLLVSLVALYVIHLTTPYLNHPLGLGMIILITTAFSVFDPRHGNS
jgi:O-antigen ligase